MSREEWNEIKQIFEAAVKLPPLEREDYVDSVCASRPGIRCVLTDLIANHSSQDSYLPTSCCDRTRSFSDNEMVAERFRIVRLICRGGMGEVYEAYDTKLRCAVALKTVRLEFAQDRQALERFRREIRISHEVAHTSICRVYDLVEHRSANSDRLIPCLTMELLAGESLAQHLAKSRPLAMDRVLPLVRQIAAALEVLHAKDIIHRDLKPSNIMMVPASNGTVRAVVMDFGLARPVRNNPEMFETRTDLQAGAPYFMAPELLTGERPSIASDVYAFGLVIDEMVTCSRAYTAESLHGLLFQKLREKPAAPSDRAAKLPEGWDRVILKCLDPVPENRYCSVADLLCALEEPPRERLSITPAQRGFTRRKLALAAVSVPVLTVGVVIANIALKPLSAAIIVFPIANETGRKDYDYICKITDSELMRRLSGVPGIGAVAHYAPRSTASRKLDTRFILEGRLISIGNGYRMVVTLTDNSNGQAFWTHEFDPFDRPASFDLQTEVTQRVIEEIDNYSTFGANENVTARVVSPIRRLFGAEPTKIPGTTTMNGDAWERYGRADQLLDKDSESSILAGIDLLKTATSIDPNFALGFAALSRAYILLSSELGHHAQTALHDAEEYAFKSLACDRQLAEPHAFLGAVHQNRWEWTDSRDNYNKALKLRPRFPQALRWFAGFFIQSGDFNEGLKLSGRAIDIDPYGIPNYLCHGMYLRCARKLKQAIDLYTGHLDSGDDGLLTNLAECYAWMGCESSGRTREQYFQRADSALTQVEQREANRNGSAPSLDVCRSRALVHALNGDGAKAHPYIARLEESMERNVGSPAAVAKLYAVLEESKTAIELLERAYVNKDPELMFIKVDPVFDSVRSSLQVQNIIRAMKLA